MKSHMLAGGNGTGIHVVETGNNGGKPILFVHGFSQCWLSWSRQMESDLADRFRLVAMDLRGHGLSEKPEDAYGDSGLWADDVNAVIEGLGLERPVICGWSYGPLPILDYIRKYGEDGVGGLNFVGGVTKLGSEEAASVITDEFLSLMEGFFSTDAQQSTSALGSLIGLCFTGQLTESERYLMLGSAASVPPYVRQGMFSRAFDNDDLLQNLGKPVLVTHGTDDRVVKADVIEKQLFAVANLQVQMIENAGHACFWDNAGQYNRVLGDFVDSL